VIVSTGAPVLPLDGFPQPPVVGVLEPVELVIVRACAFKAKGCKACGLPRSNAAHKAGGACSGFRAQRGCARCGRPKNDAGHLGTPPSLNAFGRSGDGFVYLNLKEQWGEALRVELERSKLPKGLAHVLVEGEVTFPDRQRRDQGNYRVLIEKALGDALTSGGWLPDDDWQHYEFGGLAYRYEPGVSRTRLLLFPRA